MVNLWYSMFPSFSSFYDATGYTRYYRKSSGSVDSPTSDNHSSIFTVDLPGIPREEIKLKLGRNRINVLHKDEVVYSFHIQDWVDTDSLKATLKDGRLTITFQTAKKDDQEIPIS